MLIVKGLSPRFFLADGTERRGPQGASLLHDESSQSWPYSSGLVMRFDKRGEPCDDEYARRYYGGDYEIHCGTIELPPKSISAWHLVGEVERAEYTRPGLIEPGRYEHTFGEHEEPGILDRIASFFHAAEGQLPKLYEREHALRLELGPGAVWSWRGIVWP